ncbi:hypothetical protein ACFOG5_04915 [Pedobacter fastidiosus]|uniref:hypothetical protein n=1 Tax=Pedobacter fastidiosus TaxID=2765361 RepID=UPI003616FA5E
MFSERLCFFGRQKTNSTDLPSIDILIIYFEDWKRFLNLITTYTDGIKSVIEIRFAVIKSKLLFWIFITKPQLIKFYPTF